MAIPEEVGMPVRVLIVDDQEPFRLEATRRILEGSDSVVILVLSTYEEEEYAPRAAESGAAGYIPKAAFGPDRLTEAWAAARTG